MEGNTEATSSSVLGTKDYWDERYATEVENFEQFGDEGEIWFGASAERRLIGFFNTEKSISKSARILDVGCGNGALLRKLNIAGFTNLCGMDYSSTAVDLALRCSSAADHLQIRFLTADFLLPQNGPLCGERYDVLLDKGTFDAISLSPNSREDTRAYCSSAAQLLGDGGLLVLFSCNFTQEELVEQFSELFEFFVEIPAKTSFTFGGKSGVTVCGVVFKRK